VDREEVGRSGEREEEEWKRSLKNRFRLSYMGSSKGVLQC